MDQQQTLGWFGRVSGSRSRVGRRVVGIALAASALTSVIGGVAVAQAVEDCRASRLATNVQDFGTPFAAHMAEAIGEDRNRSRRDTNAEDFGAPAPGG